MTLDSSLPRASTHGIGVGGSGGSSLPRTTSGFLSFCGLPADSDLLSTGGRPDVDGSGVGAATGDKAACRFRPVEATIDKENAKRMKKSTRQFLMIILAAPDRLFAVSYR